MVWFNRRLKNLLPVFCTVLFFLLIKLTISYTVCSSFFRVFVDAQFEQSETVQVYYAARPVFSEEKSKKTRGYSAGLRESNKVEINNHVARHIRIDLGESPGTVRLYGLRFTSFFFPDMLFSPQEIAARFLAGPGVTLQQQGNFVEVQSASRDPYIQVQSGLFYRGFFLSWTLPFLLSLGLYLFLSAFSARHFPATADLIQQKQPSSGLHFAALDGIRGFAALCVLMEHVGIMANGIGALGVHLFFALSGFLLTIPFARQPGRAVSPSYMRAYMLRRMKRIIPMYYAIITVLFLFRHKNPDVIRHYLFLQGDGYLWTVPQEMFFYMLLPLVVAVFYLLMLVQKWLAMLGLLVVIVVATDLPHKGFITLYGNGDHWRVLVGIFLSGMFFSYLYQFLQDNFFRKNGYGEEISRRVLGILGAAALLFLVVVASRKIAWLHPLDIYQNYGYSGFLAAFIIFTLVIMPRSLLARAMACLPLRAVGIVGFSFYLLHPTFIVFCDELGKYYFNIELSPVARFFISGTVTYCFAAFTYSYIERPFMK